MEIKNQELQKMGFIKIKFLRVISPNNTLRSQKTNYLPTYILAVSKITYNQKKL